jgi:hypothetical protein
MGFHAPRISSLPPKKGFILNVFSSGKNWRRKRKRPQRKETRRS